MHFQWKTLDSGATKLVTWLELNFDSNSSWIPEKTVAIEERKLGIFYEGRITDADTDFKDFTIAIQTEPTYDGFFEIEKIEPDQYSIR